MKRRVMVWRFADDPPPGRANTARRTVRGVADTGSGFVVGTCGTERRSANVNGSSGSVWDRWTSWGRIGMKRKRKRDVRFVRLIVLILFLLEGIPVGGHIVHLVFFLFFLFFFVVRYGWVLCGRGRGWGESGVEWVLLTRSTIACDCRRWKGAVGHVAGPKSPIIGKGWTAGKDGSSLHELDLLVLAEKKLGGLCPVGVMFPSVLYEAVWMAIDLDP